MSESENGLSSVEATSKDTSVDISSSEYDRAVDKSPETAEVSTNSTHPTSSGNDQLNDKAVKSTTDDFVLISDDEGDGTPEKKTVNGECSPNGVESVESEDSDDLDVIEDESDDDGGDNPDDEVEITGVSMANSEFSTVGGMDQLLRTLIEQGWTEAEIMQQLRGMIAPYQRRRKLDNFNTIDDVVDCINRVEKIIIVSGAGISVSCGIPDFRSESGLYARLSREYPTLPNPTAMFDLNFFINDPKPFFTFAKEIWPGQFQPSPCHRFIKMLEARGKLLRNYTQNIDTLEQIAGIERVIQCHGSFTTASCIYCRYQVPGDDIKSDIMEGKAPVCPKCTEKRNTEGKEAFDEFARHKYQEIKRKLRRREKISPSSGDSSSSSDNEKEVNVLPNGQETEETSSKKSDDDTAVSTSEKRTNNGNHSSPVPSGSKVDDLSTEGVKDTNSPTSEQSNEIIDSSSKKNIECGKISDSTVSDCAKTDSQSLDKCESENSRKSSEKKTPHTKAGEPSSTQNDLPGVSHSKDESSPLEPLLKPDIVFFGEDLPRIFFDHAEEDIEQAELIIVIGSSMKVKPVASIPDFVKEQTPRVLINREPVNHISFDVELLGDADEIVQQLCHRLEWESPVTERQLEKRRSPRSNIVPLDELSPLPTRSEIEGRGNQSTDTVGSSDSSCVQSASQDETSEKDANRKDKVKDTIDRHEFEEPCPLFGSRCQCPISWNIAHHLPDNTIVKMQPSKFIFPGAVVMHPKHVYPAVSVTDSFTVDSDSDLGGYENPIEVSSSDESIHVDDEVHTVSDADEGKEKSTNVHDSDAHQCKEITSQNPQSTDSITSDIRIDESSKSSLPSADSSNRIDVDVESKPDDESQSKENCSAQTSEPDKRQSSVFDQTVSLKRQSPPSKESSSDSTPSKIPRLNDVNSVQHTLSNNGSSDNQISDGTSPQKASGDGP